MIFQLLSVTYTNADVLQGENNNSNKPHKTEGSLGASVGETNTETSEALGGGMGQNVLAGELRLASALSV